jgi:hypothetical protein
MHDEIGLEVMALITVPKTLWVKMWNNFTLCQLNVCIAEFEVYYQLQNLTSQLGPCNTAGHLRFTKAVFHSLNM